MNAPHVDGIDNKDANKPTCPGGIFAAELPFGYNKNDHFKLVMSNTSEEKHSSGLEDNMFCNFDGSVIFH